MRKTNGITLIALIITIIVMLILVAVCVQVLVKSDLIGTAEKTADEYKTAYEEEQTMGQITVNGVKYDTIQDYFDNSPSTGIKIKLSMISGAEEGDEIDPETNANVSTLTEEGIPIPTGFYYVGGTKDTGVVISDDADDLNKGDGHDVVLEGNQFVWVPVEQNQKLKIEVTSEEEITSIKIEDVLLNEITEDTNKNPIMPSGTSYNVLVNPTINGIYTVTVAAGDKTEVKTLQVSSLYAQDFFSEIENEIKNKQETIAYLAEYYDTTPDELLASGKVDNLFSGLTCMDDLQEYVIKKYKEYTDVYISNHVTSVNSYGGFYIARYEAGTTQERAESSSDDVTAAVYSKKNMYPYNWISQTNSISKSETMYSATSTPAITSVTPTLINAAAWDRTLNWLIESNNTMDIEDLKGGSTGWGNFPKSYITFEGKYYDYDTCIWSEVEEETLEPEGSWYLIGTGTSAYTVKNNIYDLAGNCGERTTETKTSGWTATRGGFFDLSSYATSREWAPPSTAHETYSFRVSLYIK